MKKFLFIATMVALVMGTAVDASAKVKEGQTQSHNHSNYYQAGEEQQKQHGD